MAYTSRQKVEQYIGDDLSDIASEVTNWIASVKAWIDRYCGRTFEAASETRYYDGNGKSRIFVDPFVGTPTEVSLLNLDGTTHATLTEGATNDYVAYPLNSTEKNEIVLMQGAAIRRFTRAYFEDILDDEDIGRSDAEEDRRLLKVTADFGASATVPADVELAATKLVAQIAEKRLKGGPLASESLGDYSHSFGEFNETADALGVYNILDQWREPNI
jgi:hypothetical protein